MSAPREPSGDLCGVRDHGNRRLRCGGLSVDTLDVITKDGVSVELCVCQLHYDELKAATDPIQMAREWVR